MLSGEILLVLLIFLVLLSLFVVFAVILRRLGQIEGSIARVKVDIEGEIARVKDDIRYDILPSRRAAIKGSIVAILRNHKEVGVAFFISPTMALTAAHNLLARPTGTSLVSSVLCQRPDGDGEAFTFDVAAHDTSLDFAVLRLRKDERPSQHYLPPQNWNEVQDDKGMFLVTCNIRLALEASDITRVSVTIRPAYVTNVHPHHLLYDAQAFDGDSGGAVVIGRSGKVVGLHKELVNAARELIRQKEDAGERLKSIEVSVKSLIVGSSHGCIGVRVDSDTASRLIQTAAEQG